MNAFFSPNSQYGYSPAKSTLIDVLEVSSTNTVVRMGPPEDPQDKPRRTRPSGFTIFNARRGQSFKEASKL